MRRKTLIKAGVITTVVGIALLGISMLSGCGAKHLAEKVACATKIAGWYKHDHGKGDLLAVKTAAQDALKAARQVQGDRSKAVVDAAQAKVTTLRSAVTALRGNLPPDCAHGVNAPVGMGLMDYNAAARFEGKMVAAIERNDPNAVQSAAKSMQDAAHSGDAQFKAALKAAIQYARS